MKNDNSPGNQQGKSNLGYQTSSPRKQYAPQDTMSQIIQFNPQSTNLKSSSPHRPKDQPKQSFYFVQDAGQSEQETQEKFNQVKNNYNTNKQSITRNDKQRKQVDLSSNVFENTKNIDVVAKSPENQQLINTSVQWTNVHYGKVLTSVNEKAEFEKDYAKQRKHQELQQQYYDGSAHKSPSKIIENEINIQSKKQNQQFSDLFGQELGSKERKWLRPQRSLSPQIKWSNFDSNRDYKDFGDMSIKESKLRNINTDTQKDNQKDLHKLNHPLTSPFFDCQMSYEKIKGQYKQQNQLKQLESVPSKKFGQEKKIEQSGSNKKYEGLYSWKNNYQK
ncbi:unnamed protein product (macronuclear) [Paramecium tetraurelia]|uniref:Uncharacterized protein n=1 Tax=Paramecium tetraurelia TaxID=5888 RepID=A0BUP8_PARTE|nr:uncharacterized protein GSPATT00005511001 [Paramecium tetraurelia]CAK62265.1 unnamed protein product [Paramecium tetraurelia]|eukprot:XP_001429663.1 hypothetical protein (macronuclear) [Paramecium tetraurelia strain d4-2]